LTMSFFSAGLVSLAVERWRGLRGTRRTGVEENLFEYERTPSGEWGDIEGNHPRNPRRSSRENYLRTQFGEEEFKWNNRTCYGTRLHVAALSGILEDVERLLDAGALVDEKFGYITEYKEKDQVCDGEAIHLAASRGYSSIVFSLLERNASISSMVTRDGIDNYDVLQAAVFKEGRGGASIPDTADGSDRQLISHLVSRGANIWSKNLNGMSCMHVAFQTGDGHTIKRVEKEMLKEVERGNPGTPSIEEVAKLLALNDMEDENFTDPKRQDDERSPLEIGIRWCKMDKKALAAAAPKMFLGRFAGMGSLRTFIHCAPECIPTFMRALERDKNLLKSIPEVLADKISSKDIAKLLRGCPEAAASVLKCLTREPGALSPGWHPLPSRVSFASRHWLMVKLAPWFGYPRFYKFVTMYENECDWSYSDRSYQAPEWHNYITHHKVSPMYDVKIQVCSVPDIISPNFFSAVLDASANQLDALKLFKQCIPIRAAVNYTFWNGAIWVDVAQFLVSVWGLGLLLVETYIAHEAAADRANLTEKMSGVFHPSFITKSDGVVADWIIAKGIVDLLLELAQIRGCIVIGEPMSYLNSGNLWDLTRSILPICLLFHYDLRPLQTLIVLIYWIRLLEGVTFSERIGHALLPLHKVASGLLPAMTFTLVGFCALGHATYTVQTRPDHFWPDAVFSTFGQLMTQDWPKEPPEDWLELVLLYAGVLFFSIFGLNIFIGVINDTYSKETEQVGEMFQRLRASSCYTYLLRMRVIPCNLATAKWAIIIAFVAVILTIALQVASIGYTWQLPGVYQLLAFILCQSVTFMASIQCRGENYAWENSSSCAATLNRSNSNLGSSDRQNKRYLWICEPRCLDNEEGQERQPLRRGSQGTFSFMEEGRNSVTLDNIRQVVQEELHGNRSRERFDTGSTDNQVLELPNNPQRERAPTLLESRRNIPARDLSNCG